MYFHSLILLFTSIHYHYPLLNPFLHSFIHSLTSHSLIHSFTSCLFISFKTLVSDSSEKAVIHSFIQFFIQSFVNSLTSFYSPIILFFFSGIHSLIHFSIHSHLIHSFMHSLLVYSLFSRHLVHSFTPHSSILDTHLLFIHYFQDQFHLVQKKVSSAVIHSLIHIFQSPIRMFTAFM